MRALGGAFGHVRAFSDRDPAIDPLEATNILLCASDRPLLFAPPPLPSDPTRAAEGTAPHLHASFLAWEPPRLVDAARDARDVHTVCNGERARATGGGASEHATAGGGACGGGPPEQSALGDASDGLSRDEFEAEQAAIVATMAEIQREIMPEEGWRLLAQEQARQRRARPRRGARPPLPREPE